MAGHLLEKVSKVSTRGKSFVDFPKNSLVLVRQPLVVGVVKVSSPEGTQFHSHYKVGGRCSEYVCLDAIVS